MHVNCTISPSFLPAHCQTNAQLSSKKRVTDYYLPHLWRSREKDQVLPHVPVFSIEGPQHDVALHVFKERKRERGTSCFCVWKKAVVAFNHSFSPCVPDPLPCESMHRGKTVFENEEVERESLEANEMKSVVFRMRKNSSTSSSSSQGSKEE